MNEKRKSKVKEIGGGEVSPLPELPQVNSMIRRTMLKIIILINSN
jgi:hypothetical protein